jgi:glutathione S-transferase
LDCISETPAPVIKLHYFKGYGYSRAEAIRILLAHSGVPYEDVIYILEDEEFKKAKEKGELFEFGQVPVLEIDGKTYAQSFSILRFLGLKYGYYPSTLNPEACWEIDSIVDSVGDIMRDHYKTVY